MKCKICNNVDGNKIYIAREMLFGFRDKFQYFQCSKCQCLQLSKIPTNISKYYPSNYYSFNIPFWFSKRNNMLFRGIKRIRSNYVITKKGIIGKWIYSKYPAKGLELELRIHFPEPPKNLYTKNSRILDIGCGNGRFLNVLREAGFKNLLGIDFYNEKDTMYPNGLRIIKKSIYDTGGEYDLIMFHHSFEHMADPAKVLQATSKLLSKNGFCVIRIPIIDSHAWKYYKQDWVALDAPRHFFLHSIKSIRFLSEQLGLNIKKIVYDSDEFQFWGSEQYKLNIPLESKKSYRVNKRESIFSQKQISSFRKKAEELNRKKQGDCAAFYLQK
jgi:SAM-dependent methyltransferase